MIFAKFQNPKLPREIFVRKEFKTIESYRKFEKAAAKHGTKCIEFYDSDPYESNEIKKEK